MEAFETLIERIAPNLYAYRDQFFHQLCGDV